MRTLTESNQVTTRGCPNPFPVDLLDPNTVLGKVRLILESFTFDETDVSLTQLVRRTGIAKASVYRICQDLVAWGVVERTESGYRLGLRIFEIGQRVALQRILRETSRPYMVNLVHQTHTTAHLAIRSGVDVLYIEKISEQNEVRPSRIAGRMPIYCTATGKVILAYSPKHVLEQVVSAGLRRRTPHTITSPQRLAQSLRTIREDGVAVEKEELRLGYQSVAAPIFGGPGFVTGALSVTTFSYRHDTNRLAVSVRRAVQQISLEIQRLAVE